MMKSLIIAGWVAALPAAALAQAQQFDLVCSGVKVTELDGPEQPYDYGFRVDVAAGRWCWDTCERTFEIEEVGPDRLVFQLDRENTSRSQRYSRNEVSRIDGLHEQIVIEASPGMQFYNVKGSCSPRPFSGFPAALF